LRDITDFQCTFFKFSSETAQSNADDVGPDGVGYAWKVSEDTDGCDVNDDDGGDEDEVFVKVDPSRARSIGCREEEAWKLRLWDHIPAPADDFLEDDELDGEVDENEEMNVALGAGGSQSSSQASSFKQIVFDMVSSGYAEGHPPESILMEIKGYKFAQNKTFADCITGVVPSIISIAVAAATGPEDAPTGSIKNTQFLKKLKELLAADAWGHRLVNALIQEGHPEASEELQIIRAVEDAALSNASLYQLFRFILQICYDSELLTEDGILQWVEDSQDDEDDEEENERDTRRKVLFNEPSVQEFVKWIKDSEEDDDDEEEEEEEEDDDE